jgi:hypothetical protein
MTTGPAPLNLPALLNLVDETIEAFVRLDSDALVALEQQASAHSSVPLALSAEMTRTLLRKKALLGHVLDDAAFNLALLRRLRSTNGDSSWAR